MTVVTALLVRREILFRINRFTDDRVDPRVSGLSRGVVCNLRTRLRVFATDRLLLIDHLELLRKDGPIPNCGLHGRSTLFAIGLSVDELTSLLESLSTASTLGSSPKTVVTDPLEILDSAD